MDETIRETKRWFDAAAVSVEQYFFFSSLAIVVLFAWMEPAGSAGVGFGKGLVFWTIQVSILIPLLICIQHLASHYVNLKTPQTPWIQTTLSGVIAALLFVPVAYFLDTVFGMPEDEASMGIIHGLLDEASGVVVPVTVVWIALNAPWILQLDFSTRHSELAPLELDQHREKNPSKATEPTRFMQELRKRTSGELVSISSELHYVRVVTTESEVMFLYNLKDALEELPADAGVQIHRSHWVSRGHVKDLSRTDGCWECTLSNGRRLPISRRKYSEIKNLLGV